MEVKVQASATALYWGHNLFERDRIRCTLSADSIGLIADTNVFLNCQPQSTGFPALFGGDYTSWLAYVCDGYPDSEFHKPVKAGSWLAVWCPTYAGHIGSVVRVGCIKGNNWLIGITLVRPDPEGGGRCSPLPRELEIACHINITDQKRVGSQTAIGHESMALALATAIKAARFPVERIRVIRVFLWLSNPDFLIDHFEEVWTADEAFQAAERWKTLTNDAVDQFYLRDDFTVGWSLERPIMAIWRLECGVSRVNREVHNSGLDWLRFFKGQFGLPANPVYNQYRNICRVAHRHVADDREIVTNLEGFHLRDACFKFLIPTPPAPVIDSAERAYARTSKPRRWWNILRKR